MHKSLFDIDKKILSALNSKKPIVALESTLISHGLPFPENVKVAQSSIDAVEESGSIAINCYQPVMPFIQNTPWWVASRPSKAWNLILDCSFWLFLCGGRLTVVRDDIHSVVIFPDHHKADHHLECVDFPPRRTEFAYLYDFVFNFIFLYRIGIGQS